MASSTRAASIRAAAHVFALAELCAVIAEHSGVVGACRLTRVCKATLQGSEEWLRTLPGLVVCGGCTSCGPSAVFTMQVRRLDLGELRWECMPDLTCERALHACCTVRRGVVVLGGVVEGRAGPEVFAGVEILGGGLSTAEGTIFKALAPLSCGAIADFAAVADRRERERARAGASHRMTERA
jgi:hypothetical protein